MRSHLRTVLIVVLACVLVGAFLYRVDFWGVAATIVRARPEWLVLALFTMPINLAMRARRWQYLLEPLGRVGFGISFRATAVGFAATALLPARAGEVIRPYFLARTERMSATGAFATIVIERLVDVITVLVLLASYVFVFGRDVGRANPTVFLGVKWAGAVAAGVSICALTLLFVLAGDPSWLRQRFERLERALPSALAGLVARIVEKFAKGLGVVRRPGRLFVALLWSFPLWLSIGLGIYAVARAFHLAVPFTGSFLMIALLVIGVAAPTPGAIGGFHEAFRLGATTFYGASDDAAVGAAIVLHLMTIGPSLMLGLFFAAHEGLNLSAMRRLADQRSPAPGPGGQDPARAARQWGPT